MGSEMCIRDRSSPPHPPWVFVYDLVNENPRWVRRARRSNRAASLVRRSIRKNNLLNDKPNALNARNVRNAPAVAERKRPAKKRSRRNRLARIESLPRDRPGQAARQRGDLEARVQNRPVLKDVAKPEPQQNQPREQRRNHQRNRHPERPRNRSPVANQNAVRSTGFNRYFAASFNLFASPSLLTADWRAERRLDVLGN